MWRGVGAAQRPAFWLNTKIYFFAWSDNTILKIDCELFSPLKGQSMEIFDLYFFQYSNLFGPLTNRLTYFIFWLRLHSYSSFGFKKLTCPWRLTRRALIPQGVMFWQIFVDSPGRLKNQKRINVDPFVSGPSR